MGAGDFPTRSNQSDMKLKRLMGDLTQLRRETRDLASESAAEEEQAKNELTASARRFSRRTRHVVDDKLSFSATLMRAGEVGAANRLLEEVEIDVRTEEAALIEKMNEVKVARATTRERMTRVRLTRMLAVSLAGSLIMGFSALGMAAAGFVEDREQDQIRRNVAAQRRALEGGSDARRTAAAKLRRLDRDVRKLLLAGDVPLTSLSSLTAAEIRTIDALTAGTVDLGALQSFLASVLPTPDLAREVATKIAGQVDGVIAAAEAGAEEATGALPARVKKRAQRAESEAEAQADAQEPPQEDTDPSPSPDETQPPEEQQTERDGRQQETGGGGDDKNGGDDSGSIPNGEDLPLDGV